jgi:hypothetical protein
MATWPTWVDFEWRGLQVTPDSITTRSAMDRGIPKQRRVQSDQRHVVTLPLSFKSAAQVVAFEDWVRLDLASGMAWFDFALPWRPGVTVQARIVDGKLGPLSYQQRTLQAAQRTVTIEYWVSAW